VKFDIIVMGGGHAGLEAAWIASSFKSLRVALVSMPGVPLGSTPCNPAVGGVGKGQVVRELDALGGLMGALADKAGIQYRILNESKGYAVQSTRVQVDKDLYAQAAHQAISESAVELIIAKVVAVSRDDFGHFKLSLDNDSVLECHKLIVTTGTFLNGKLHTGEQVRSGGRVDAMPSAGLQELFSEVQTLGKRFKTGTPPRLRFSSLNLSELEEQPSDYRAQNFHFQHGEGRISRQVSCYLSRTTRACLDLIRANKDRSPMYNGQISGIGPRYCPSIEDKAFRYPDRHEHHVFLEPEGLNTESVYPNGLSTSLPADVQEAFLKFVPGLENAEILVHGYAVEYDVVDTSRLDSSLQYFALPGLYFAGQVNGTSGYEEAAAQGYVAGVNAALSVLERTPLIFSREDSYIGVLIEDLITTTRDEPYRLFTARSENRLFIREDNSYVRMAHYRQSLGLHQSIDVYLRDFTAQFHELYSLCSIYRTKNRSLFPPDFSNFVHGQVLDEYLSRGALDPVQLLEFFLSKAGVNFDQQVVKAVAISKKYGGYINRAHIELQKLSRIGEKRLQWRKLLEMHNISFECRQRIEQFKPETFDQLQRIEGIRPATLVFVSGMLT
jgi:tRNA uridine 5-carboxymethylaminomethyl modification enzyme